EMIWQFLLSILSMLVSVVTGWTAFGVPLSIMHWMMIPAMLAGIMTFSGIGMIGARIVKSPNAAGAIGNVLTYPMMFLSGAFFDVSHIPALYYISKALPLTYIVDTMRAAMVTNNMPIAWMNLGISFGLAVIFMGIGILFTKWTED
ncbi:MAG: ABC transporter permease, partial [Asgard group archaeon]|nr:ABC transporter permease [Asgard group archaeon]